MQFNKIYPSGTSLEHKKYLLNFVKTHRPRFETYVVPAAGQFDLVTTLISAGVKPEQIEVSDTSMFGLVVGYYVSGQPLSELNIHFELDFAENERYEALETELDRAAFVLLTVKKGQLNDENWYERSVLQDLLFDEERYFLQVKKALKQLKEKLSGITFKFANLDEIVGGVYDDSTLMVINPASMTAAYASILCPHNISFVPPEEVAEYSGKKHFRSLYIQSRKAPYVALWYKDAYVPKAFLGEVCFLRENWVGNRDYWLATKDIGQKKVIKYRKDAEVEPFRGLTVISDEDKIKLESKIVFIECTLKNALYYYNLFSHQLLDTRADSYFLALVDNKIFGVCGVKHKSVSQNKLSFATVAFALGAPLKNNPLLTRLLLACTVSEEFKPYILSVMPESNRLFDLNGTLMRFLSSSRAVEVAVGILHDAGVDKLEDDLFAVYFSTVFQDWSFKEAIFVHTKELQNNTPKHA